MKFTEVGREIAQAKRGVNILRVECAENNVWHCQRTVGAAGVAVKANGIYDLGFTNDDFGGWGLRIGRKECKRTKEEDLLQKGMKVAKDCNYWKRSFRV